MGFESILYWVLGSLIFGIVLRELFLWYWRINTIIENQEKTNKLLVKNQENMNLLLIKLLREKGVELNAFEKEKLNSK
jgi:hypothetical protein